MTDTVQAGSGVSLTDPVDLSLVQTAAPRVELSPEGQALLETMREEFRAAVADVEFRLAQTYEIASRVDGVPNGRVYVEDIHDQKHRLTGYVLTSNSPVAGSIAWASLHIVYLGVDYTIADGNTANKFVWFVKPGSGTTATLQSSNTQPTLGANDTLVFINNAGTAIDATASNVAWAVAPGTIGDSQISGGIAQSKVAGLGTALTAAMDAAAAAQATADGAISSTWGPTFPWVNGTVKPSANTGDTHTFQQSADPTNFPDGSSYRWSGPGGSPANTWVLITDTALSKALADSASALGQVSGKTTTYYRTTAQGAPTTPLGGATNFTVGDQYQLTDGTFAYYRNTAATPTGTWVLVTIGDANIASGINGSKIGAGLSPANLTGAGTAPVAAIPQLGPGKLSTAFHMLY